MTAALPLLGGKRLAVLGSARGLGRAVAEAAGRAGAEVLGIDDSPAFEHVQEFYRADLDDPAALDLLADTLPEGLDGLALFPALPDTGPAAVLARGIVAPRRLAERLAPRMAPGAAIVVRGAPPHADRAAALGMIRAALALKPGDAADFAARWGLVAEPGHAPRLAGWAMQAWAMARRWTWADRAIRVASLTPASPDGRLPPAIVAARGIEAAQGQAQAAQATIFLLSDLAAGLTGANLAADSGLSAHVLSSLEGL